MERFEYEITLHSAEAYRQLVYVCSEKGECSAGAVPEDQTKLLARTLNELGAEGWELVQVHFMADAVMAIWKRGLLHEGS